MRGAALDFPRAPHQRGVRHRCAGRAHARSRRGGWRSTTAPSSSRRHSRGRSREAARWRCCTPGRPARTGRLRAAGYVRPGAHLRASSTAVRAASRSSTSQLLVAQRAAVESLPHLTGLGAPVSWPVCRASALITHRATDGCASRCTSTTNSPDVHGRDRRHPTPAAAPARGSGAIELSGQGHDRHRGSKRHRRRFVPRVRRGGRAGRGGRSRWRGLRGRRR